MNVNQEGAFAGSRFEVFSNYSSDRCFTYCCSSGFRCKHSYFGAAIESIISFDFNDEINHL